MNRIGLLVSAAALGCPALALAADATADNTAPAHTVTGVVVTAPPNAPLTSTFTESTVTSVEIQKLSPGPTVTVQTLLNAQPSIFAFTDGPFGVRTNITFRAFNSGQFTETYDGISLNDSFNAAVTGGAENVNNVLLQTQDIDSVQVYRGVNNPAVNGYNSLGGTINFIPKAADAAQGLELGASYGSFNTFQAHASFNTGDFHGLRQLATFAYGRTDGWQLNTSDWNYNFYYTLGFEPAPGQLLRFYSVVNHNEGFPPDNIPLPLLQLNGFNYQFPKNIHNHSIYNTNWLGIIDYEWDVNPNVIFDNKAFAGWDTYKRKSFTNPAAENSPFPGSGGIGYFLDDGGTGFPFWLCRMQADCPGSQVYPTGPTYDPVAVFGDPTAGTDYHFYGYETWTAGYQPSLTLNLPRNKIIAGANLTWGWLWSREYWWGNAAIPTLEGFNNAWEEWDFRFLGSVYVQDEIAIIPDTLFVTPGVKYLYAHTSDTDHVGFFYPFKGTSAGDEHFISPTVGVSYKPTSTVAVYGAFGENIKFPDITAFYNGIQLDVNGNLFVPPVRVKPEHVNDYELGARYESGGFFAEVDVYREDFTDIFVTVPIPPLFINNLVQNGGSARYQGVEVQLKDAFHWLDSDWTAYFNYAHNQAKYLSGYTDQVTGAMTVPGAPVANVPQDLASAGVSWSWNGWEANADLRYVGKEFTDAFQSGQPTPNTTPAYVVVNIGAAKTFPVRMADRTGSVKLAINVDNLFDKRYFNEAFTDFSFDQNGKFFTFLRPVVGAPLGVTGSVSAKF